jgi:hypothetical protein
MRIASVPVNLPFGVTLSMPGNSFVFAFDELLVFYNIKSLNLELDSAHLNDIMLLDFVFLPLVLVNDGFDHKVHTFGHVVGGQELLT